MTKTKKELRNALKALASEINSSVKYEKSMVTPMPVKDIQKWAHRIFELSEDDALWD